MSRGQLVRIMLGVSVLVAGAAIYLPEVLYTTSSEAILNARIVSLAAPIEGHVVNAPPPEGTVVAMGAVLLTLANPNVDRSRLIALEEDRTKTATDLAAAQQVSAALTEELASLDEQMSFYHSATVARLELATRESQADAIAAGASAAEAQHNVERKRALRFSGVISPADFDQAEQGAIRNEAVAARTRLTAERLGAELAAARRGVYVAEDRNDVPYSQQRADEFHVRQIEADAQEKALAARLTQLDRQLADERARIQRLSSAEVKAPTTGVVWRPLVTTGSPVAQDSNMLTLIDCSEIFATATLSGRRFDDLRPGGRAIVHVLGGDADYSGTIVDVRAMQRSVTEERFAAPLPKLGDRQILAILKIDHPAGLGSGNYCNVGRRIEVRFGGLGAVQSYG